MTNFFLRLLFIFLVTLCFLIQARVVLMDQACVYYVAMCAAWVLIVTERRVIMRDEIIAELREIRR